MFGRGQGDGRGGNGISIGLEQSKVSEVEQVSSVVLTVDNVLVAPDGH